MADLFEQLVADYLTEQGYLCKTNVNYRKADGKQSGSDIDVLALRQMPPHDVIVGDCKSWAYGFSGDWVLAGKNTAALANREYFKAIFQQVWEEGLALKVEQEFGTRQFTYVIYCTWKDGSCEQLEAREKVAGNPIRVVTLAEMIRDTVQRIRERKKKTRAVEPTTLGRFVQLLDHAKIRFSNEAPGGAVEFF